MKHTRQLPGCSFRRRSGVSMPELIAAASLFAVIATLLVPAISGVADVRESAVANQLAVLEAANLMEQIAILRESGPVTEQQLHSLSLSPGFEEQLTAPRLSIAVSEPTGSPPARQIELAIDWETIHGTRGEPVTVVTYFHEPEETGDTQR